MTRAIVAVAAVLLTAGCTAVKDAVLGPETPTTATADTAPVALAATTTTAAPPPPPTTAAGVITAAPGQNVVDALLLGEGGLGRARFGMEAARAVEYVRSVLGSEDEDTEWGDPVTGFGRCPGTEARVLRWGKLLVVLSDRSRYGDGRQHFAGWRYGPAVEESAFYPEGLVMGSGLTPGLTLADVQGLYPGAVAVTPAAGADPPLFRVGSSFGGWLTGTDPAASVVALDAGQPCQPIPA